MYAQLLDQQALETLWYVRLSAFGALGMFKTYYAHQPSASPPVRIWWDVYTAFVAGESLPFFRAGEHHIGSAGLYMLNFQVWL